MLIGIKIKVGIWLSQSSSDSEEENLDMSYFKHKSALLYHDNDTHRKCLA